MTGLNFSQKWRSWVRECITSASTAILVNGSPTKNFNMERGIRQGDPLSPFLFLIVAEGLSILTKKAVELGILEAAEVGRKEIKISHLQYADDTIFSCPGKMENAVAIKHLLRNFELLSGLKVNFHKCALLGINMQNETVQAMANYLRCEVSKPPFSYLGINVEINHRLATSWRSLTDKVRQRLHSWNGKHLSLEGRITLIQSILSAAFCQLCRRIVSHSIKSQRKS